LGSVWIYGSWRLHHAPSVTQHHPVLVRIIQGNVQPQIVQSNAHRATTLQRYESLTREATPLASYAPQILIWPEAALPYPAMTPLVRQPGIADLVPKPGIFITGAARIEPSTMEVGGGTSYHWFNSILAYDDTGMALHYYDKQHLVPFGEFVPFRWFKPIAWAAEQVEDLSRGTGLRLVQLPAPFTPFVPLICYEDIFPGLSIAPEAPVATQRYQ